MRKIHRNSKLLALTLTASIATFGCTTNWTRSDGEPATGATNVTSPSATPGSSGGTTLPQPMTSSSQITTRTPEQALAVMQQTRSSLGPQAIVLGQSNPPNTGQPVIGGYGPSSFGTIRQMTINSSISNPLGPQPAIVSGAGEGVDAAALFGDVVVGTDVTPAATVTTATNGLAALGTVPSTIATAPATTIAGTTSTTATTATATPTSAAVPVTSGVFSASTGTFSPTSSSGSVPTPTVATSPVVLGASGMLSSSSLGTTTSAIVTPRTTSAMAVRSSGTTTTGRLNRSAVTLPSTTSTSTITVSQTASGKIVISNIK